MSRFETPKTALARAQAIAKRERQRQSAFATAATRVRQRLRQQQVSVAEQNRLTREFGQRLSAPEQARYFGTLTPAQQLQEARGGGRQATSADIGAPADRGTLGPRGLSSQLLSPVVPAEVNPLPGSAGRLTSALSNPVGAGFAAAFPAATLTGLAGGTALGEVGGLAERAGVSPVQTPIGGIGPRGVGEFAGGFFGGPGRGAATAGGRRIGTNLPEAVSRAGGIKGIALGEAGGTDIAPITWRRVLKDIIQGNETTADNMAVRGQVEDIIARTGKTADDLLAEGPPVPHFAERGGTRIRTRPGEEVEPLASARQKFSNYSRQVSQRRTIIDLTRSEQRGERAALKQQLVDEALARGVPHREALEQSDVALRGKYQGFADLPGLELSPEENEAIWETIARTRPFEQKRLTTLMHKIEAADPELAPQPNELALARQILGDEFATMIEDVYAGARQFGKELGQDYPRQLPAAKAAADISAAEFPREAIEAGKFKATPNQKHFLEKALDTLKVPQTFKQAFDFSIHLRQLAKGGWRNPKEWWDSLAADAASFRSEKVANSYRQAMDTDPRMIAVRTPDGIKQMTYGEVARDIMKIHKGEDQSEFFMSEMAKRFPGVGQSARGFAIGGDKFTHDVGYKMVDKIISGHGLGPLRRAPEGAISEERLRAIGNLVNRLSGRGELGTGFIAKTLKQIGWAPGYRASGPQAMMQMLNRDPFIRRQAIENIVPWFSGNMAILGLAYMGGKKVGIDPFSSEFGKIRIGNTSYNLWGTDQVLARTIAQAVNGEGVTRTGKKFPVTPAKAIETYIRSGLDPVIASGVDILSQKNIVGEPRDFSKEGLKSLLNDQLPLSFQDVQRIWESDNPIQAIASAPLTTLGLGATAYETRQNPKYPPEFYDLPEETQGDIENILSDVDKMRSDMRKRGQSTSDIPVESSIQELGRREKYDNQLVGWAIRLHKAKEAEEGTTPKKAKRAESTVPGGIGGGGGGTSSRSTRGGILPEGRTAGAIGGNR